MFEDVIILAFVVLFIHACTWEGMILEAIAMRCKNWPSFIKNPLFDCPVCMTPWWGFGIYNIARVLHAVPEHSVFQIIITLFAAAGVNVLLSNIVYFIQDYIITVQDGQDSTGSDR